MHTSHYTVSERPNLKQRAKVVLYNNTSSLVTRKYISRLVFISIVYYTFICKLEATWHILQHEEYTPCSAAGHWAARGCCWLLLPFGYWACCWLPRCCWLAAGCSLLMAAAAAAASSRKLYLEPGTRGRCYPVHESCIEICAMLSYLSVLLCIYIFLFPYLSGALPRLSV